MKHLGILFITIIVQSNANISPDATATGQFRSDVRSDGSYSYQYDTSNGISAQESGVGGVSARGQASWTAPDGTPISFTYIADENGYRAEGPFVPATPPHVIRLLEYLKTHPQKQDDEYQYNNRENKKPYVKPQTTFEQKPQQPHKFPQQQPQFPTEPFSQSQKYPQQQYQTESPLQNQYDSVATFNNNNNNNNQQQHQFPQQLPNFPSSIIKPKPPQVLPTQNTVKPTFGNRQQQFNSQGFQGYRPQGNTRY